MSIRSSRTRIQPSISEACVSWIDKYAKRWDVSRDVATAKILEAVSESPWTNLIFKQPDTEISVERMEILLKKKTED